MRGLTAAYRALCDVYIQRAFVGEAVKKYDFAECKGALRVVYGTLEEHYLYEYRISRLAAKAPKTPIAVLLKMGMYLIDHMDNEPNEVVVSEIVDTARSVGKGEVSGFINAVLRRYIREGHDLMPQEETERLSVLYNRPTWLVKRYIKEWGKSHALEILTAKGCDKTHIRPASSYGQDALRAYLEAKGIPHEETHYGFNIGSVGEVGELLRKGEATVMSRCSVEICAAVPVKGEEILDMCAAPGGKSVCLAERSAARVIACDKHPHRVELIRQYAERMHAQNVEPRCMDSTVFEPSFEDRFMTVLLDAPCSGLGTVRSNPDVVIHRKESDLADIITTQKALIEVAARYVKKGGSLVYATCSDLPSEDSLLVADFLQKHAEFALRAEKYTETDQAGGEGYYYAVLEKV